MPDNPTRHTEFQAASQDTDFSVVSVATLGEQTLVPDAANDGFEPILWKNNVLLLQKVWF
ncbi:hypothetical protein [Roseovarius litorisediminis]|uniref:hypothetical protein n=1 Tax=Roseovarius litorisediminis TaxID=1312363 RepID=UPI000A268DF3|nr:hypothetical protein [Roseovarius litorisediminis]